MAFTDKLTTPSRWIFAIAITDFGIQNLISARSSDPPFIPVIPWLPLIPALAYLTGAFLLLSGLALLANFRPRLAALLLAVFFIAVEIVELIPRAFAVPFDLGIRTIVLEALCIAAGAMLIARVSPAPPQDRRWLSALLASARYLIALSMVLFGIAHFLLLKFIGSLIPVWLKGNPTGGVAWAAFTGGFMILAGILIALYPLLPRASRIAALLLGLMFLLWFLLLHLPRVFSSTGLHKPDEWQSAFICLAMCAVCWLLATQPPRPLLN